MFPGRLTAHHVQGIEIVKVLQHRLVTSSVAFVTPDDLQVFSFSVMRRGGTAARYPGPASRTASTCPSRGESRYRRWRCLPRAGRVLEPEVLEASSNWTVFVDPSRLYAPTRSATALAVGDVIDEPQFLGMASLKMSGLPWSHRLGIAVKRTFTLAWSETAPVSQARMPRWAWRRSCPPRGAGFSCVR